MLPLAKPALATLAIFTLLGAWNDLIWPLVAISDEHCYTLQVGLANFQGTAAHRSGRLLMAGNVVATMPLIIAFLLAQRSLRRDHDLHRPQRLTRQSPRCTRCFSMRATPWARSHSRAMRGCGRGA